MLSNNDKILPVIFFTQVLILFKAILGCCEILWKTYGRAKCKFSILKHADKNLNFLLKLNLIN